MVQIPDDPDRVAALFFVASGIFATLFFLGLILVLLRK